MRITVQDFVEANLYPNEESVIQEALQLLLQAHPEMKIEMALDQYQKEQLTLEEAAKLAGVGWGQMKNILVERGIPLRLSSQNLLQNKKALQFLQMKEKLWNA